MISRKFQTVVRAPIHAEHLHSIIKREEMTQADFLRQVLRMVRLLDDHGITVARMIECVGDIVDCILESFPGKKAAKAGAVSYGTCPACGGDAISVEHHPDGRMVASCTACGESWFL